MLRDRLVVGIDNEAIQRRLLSESTLTFKKALKLAQSLEAAARNTREIQNGGIKINGRTGSNQDNQRTEPVGRVATNDIAVEKLVISRGNAHSRMRNVIIAGKCVTSKGPVATSWTVGVCNQKLPDRVNNKQRKLQGEGLSKQWNPKTLHPWPNIHYIN